jgi:hypothetical protein
MAIQEMMGMIGAFIMHPKEAGTEGGRQPESTWGPGNTVLLGVAQSRDMEFISTDSDREGKIKP